MRGERFLCKPVVGLEGKADEGDPEPAGYRDSTRDEE
jgi:hypothetical protein